MEGTIQSLAHLSQSRKEVNQMDYDVQALEELFASEVDERVMQAAHNGLLTLDDEDE